MTWLFDFKRKSGHANDHFFYVPRISSVETNYECRYSLRWVIVSCWVNIVSLTRSLIEIMPQTVSFWKTGKYRIFRSVINCMQNSIESLSVTGGRSFDIISATLVSVEDFPFRITFLE